MKKHMAEAYIVSYADSIDADVENIISYPRNSMNPILNTYMYESVNGVYLDRVRCTHPVEHISIFYIFG